MTEQSAYEPLFLVRSGPEAPMSAIVRGVAALRETVAGLLHFGPPENMPEDVAEIVEVFGDLDHEEWIECGVPAHIYMDFEDGWIAAYRIFDEGPFAAPPPAPVDDERLREIRERVEDDQFLSGADNVYLLDTIASLQARVVELEGILHRVAEAVEPPLDEHGVWAGTVAEAVAATVNRAEAAEAERDGMREALEAAEDLYQTGLLRADPEFVERVHALRRAALKDTTHDQ